MAGDMIVGEGSVTSLDHHGLQLGAPSLVLAKSFVLAWERLALETPDAARATLPPELPPETRSISTIDSRRRPAALCPLSRRLPLAADRIARVRVYFPSTTPAPTLRRATLPELPSPSPSIAAAWVAPDPEQPPCTCTARAFYHVERYMLPMTSPSP